MNLKLTISIFLVLFFFFQEQQNEKDEDIENDWVEWEVTCSERQKPSDNALDPVLIKTCDYKDFRSIKTGRADYKGRYSYYYQLFKIDKNGKRRIKNSEIFSSETDLLEKKINQDLQRDYEKKLSNPKLKDCMKQIDFRYYGLNEMGMAFSDNNKIEFHITYQISGACFNVRSTVLYYEFAEFKEHLNVR